MAKRAATSEEKKVTFARHGRWLIPVSERDMKVLTKFNLRLTKWDADYVGTMRLILSKKNYSVEIVPFGSTILDPTMERLEKFWCCGKNKLLISKGQIKLLGPNEPSNVQKLRTIESKVRIFFDRWGFDVDVTSNETKTRCGLTFDYHFSSNRDPVVTIGDQTHIPDFDPAILEMDNYRLVLSRHGDHYGFSFEEKVRDEWTPIKRNSSMSYSKLKSSRMISTLFEMFNMN